VVSTSEARRVVEQVAAIADIEARESAFARFLAGCKSDALETLQAVIRKAPIRPGRRVGMLEQVRQRGAEMINSKTEYERRVAAIFDAATEEGQLRALDALMQEGSVDHLPVLYHHVGIHSAARGGRALAHAVKLAKRIKETYVASKRERFATYSNANLFETFLETRDGHDGEPGSVQDQFRTLRIGLLEELVRERLHHWLAVDGQSQAYSPAGMTDSTEAIDKAREERYSHLSRLVGIACERGLTPGQLDGAVNDAFGGPEVNNAGREAQIEFLLDHNPPSVVEKILRTVDEDGNYATD
jgi:hypothetical protein